MVLLVARILPRKFRCLLTLAMYPGLCDIVPRVGEQAILQCGPGCILREGLLVDWYPRGPDCPSHAESSKYRDLDERVWEYRASEALNFPLVEVDRFNMPCGVER